LPDLEPLATEAVERGRRFVKAQLPTWVRYAKMGVLMLVSAVAIPIVMISLGALLGPKGYEGLLLTPVTVLLSWALILYWGMRRRVTPRRIATSKLSQLPSRTVLWLEEQRPRLPRECSAAVDALLVHLKELEPQLEHVGEGTRHGERVRRLLVEELTGLVEHHGRVPPRLRQRPLHGGASPDARLASGLATVATELEHVQEELAQQDLFSLATKQRYLDSKYKDGGT
jgi:hypothetical protein